MANGDDQQPNLEPVVATVVAEQRAQAESLKALTEDVRSLTSSVRMISDNTSRQIGELANNTSRQLNDLSIAVTQAKGPRETNWLVLLTAGSVIITILTLLGAAIVWPIQMEVTFNRSAHDDLVREHREQFQTLSKDLHDHEKLPLHPVGGEKIAGLEKRLDDICQNGTRGASERLVKLDEIVKQQGEMLKDVAANGTPIGRDRFARLETHFEDMMRLMDEVRKEGSPITRERLSTLEEYTKNHAQQVKTDLKAMP